MVHGKFVISLDFELMWGVRDKKSKELYGERILGVHQVIPKLLEIFTIYGVEATFSTVGFLFFETKQQLIESLPIIKPEYLDENLSPYNGYLDTIGNNYREDPYHYGYQLIKEIQKYPNQEIGTHTFCHYYCLESNQTIDQFKIDLLTAINVANLYGIKLTSLIFPRNQFNENYLKVCHENGIICYRGNEDSWLYSAKKTKNDTLLRRAFRLIDTYINISGHNCYTDEYIKHEIPVNIPSSRFLRPFSKKLKTLEGLRLLRIKKSMTYAAKHNLTFHLWWHPHNFGINQDENFRFLEKILKHYKYLNSKYNFQSYTMSALAQKVLDEK